MADPTSAIVESLKAIKLIPDLLPTSLIETDKWAPSVLFSIVYPNAEIVLGEEIQRDLTIDEPDIVFSPLNIPFKDDQESYTLVMYDPDAPSKADPKYKSFRHWVVCLACSLSSVSRSALTLVDPFL
ncbi:hypothetical protein DL96DRAFT_1579592 [Flagelloscypha sp. PMI_526]|nr:hypothetical protein DL96DRAFT_1579592 [Flagelloscypha sp. PMI_526]